MSLLTVTDKSSLLPVTDKSSSYYKLPENDFGNLVKPEADKRRVNVLFREIITETAETTQDPSKIIIAGCGSSRFNPLIGESLRDKLEVLLKNLNHKDLNRIFKQIAEDLILRDIANDELASEVYKIQNRLIEVINDRELIGSLLSEWNQQNFDDSMRLLSESAQKMDELQKMDEFALTSSKKRPYKPGTIETLLNAYSFSPLNMSLLESGRHLKP